MIQPSGLTLYSSVVVKRLVHIQGLSKVALNVMEMAISDDQVLTLWKSRKRKPKSYGLKAKV